MLDPIKLHIKMRIGSDPRGTKEIIENGTYNVKDCAKAIVNVRHQAQLQSKTATPTKQQQEVTADAGFDGLDTVTVEKIPDEYIQPTGTKTITTNGTHDVKDYENAAVNVTPDLQSKTATPAETQQIIRPDADFDGLDSVTVERIPEEYIIPTGTKTISQNGVFWDVKQYEYATVQVTPALTSKTVTPTKQQQVINPDSGYDGLRRVTVEKIPDEYIIPEGTKNITENGTHDVKDYENAAVNVTPELQNKTVTPTEQQQEIRADAGYDGLDRVTVERIPAEYVKPEGAKTITENGQYDVTNYAQANVDIFDKLDDYISSGFNVIETHATKVRPYGCAGLWASRINLLSATLIESNAFFQAGSDHMFLYMPSLLTVNNNAFTASRFGHIRMPRLSTMNSNFYTNDTLITADLGNIIKIGSTVSNQQALKVLALRYTTTVQAEAPFSSIGVLGGGHGYILVPRGLISQYIQATNWADIYTAGTQFLALEDYTQDGTTTGELDEDKIDALLE